jgi:hypothetical protein
MPRSGRVLLLCLGAACVTSAAACGFGTYADTGSPEPGTWWPWVCPDSGDLAPEAGCLPPEAGSDACADGSGDEGCP